MVVCVDPGMKELFKRSLPDPITALDVHASSSSVVSGDIEGNITVLSGEKFKASAKLKVHKKSLRSLALVDNSAISASSSGHVAISDINTCQVLRRLKLPKKTPISQMQLINPHTVALGDDDGVLTILDLRKPDQDGLVRRASLFDDYISSLISSECAPNNILITSGDGSLKFYDYITGKIVAKCDGLEDEITCATKQAGENNNTLCMTATGAINVFKYDYWGQPDDRVLLKDGISNCCSGDNGAAYISLFGGDIFEFKNHSVAKILQLEDDITCLKFDSASKRLLASNDNQLHFFTGITSQDKGNFFDDID